MKNNQFVLGIDTSNYTTSVALYNLSDNTVRHKRKFLPVADGQCGLRQSDAVFHHTQQLHVLVKELFNETEQPTQISAIGVSTRPRDQEGSYMPCFTVGINTANILGSVLNVPVYNFSHQMGHIAAAIYSSNSEYLYNKEFIAFHVSGGTTEAVLVKPDSEKIFTAEIVGKTLDLHAGQAIDRVGVSLGLSFPCGKELEKLALNCNKRVNVKTCIKNNDCCLSGIQNICEKLIKNKTDYEEVALTCLTFVGKSLDGMCSNILSTYGNMPILFAGGVMSNSIIKNMLSEKFDCVFALPEFSTDNACGTAVLAAAGFQKELNV
ncbi:MAG: peptidase M22 [Clostridia bacterium]|nr:peptidase M22 [Clostridia bacterium]